jgi:hypothetical protein
MYATCLFCNGALGANEALETFPVGRRLAFDSARGRLWVVCPRCERWNLTPLEERWEAIEQAERLYRDTRRRVATDNIGLGKLRDGTTLVRIGEPLRPEFAAWRYGDQFGRRRRRQGLIAAAGLAGLGVLTVGGAVAGVGVGAFAWLVARSGSMIVAGDPEKVVARIRTADGRTLPVRRRHLGETVLSRADDGSLALDLRYKNGKSHFEGKEAQRIASIVVPKVNRFGGNKRAVAEAVREIESMGSAEGFLDQLTQTAHVYTRPLIPRRKSWFSNSNSDFAKHGLYGLPGPQRLALEMALHEEAERRAMQGELMELETAWRDAEEIAAISDDLLLPAGVDAAIRRMKETGTG